MGHPDPAYLTDEQKLATHMRNGSALHMPDAEKEVQFLAALAGYCAQKTQELEGLDPTRRARLGRFWRQLYNDWSDRGAGGSSLDANVENAIQHGVFDHSNISFNEIRSQVYYIVAKIREGLFGTMPFFAATPQGPANGTDPDLARDVEKYLNFKFSQAGSNLEMATAAAALAGAAVGCGITKTRYERKTRFYMELREILTRADGTPVVTPEGEYIYKTDRQIPHQGPVEPGGPIKLPQGYDSTKDGPKLFYFEKHPKQLFSQTDLSRFVETPMEAETVEFKGARTENVHFDDFFADPNQPELENCDFIFHRFDMRASKLKQMAGAGRITKADYAKLASAATPDQSTSASGQGQLSNVGGDNTVLPHDPEALHSWTTQEGNTYVAVRECYIDYDVPIAWENGEVSDTRTAKLFVTFAKDTGEVIYADYLGNIMPKGKLPFTAFPYNQRPGKWWGHGLYEEFEAEQHFIDSTLNQIIFRNDIAANPTVIKKDGIFIEDEKDGQANTFQVGAGKVYRMADSTEDPSKAVHVVQLPDLDSSSYDLLDRCVQKITMTTGVTSAAQGDTGAMSAQNTATGVKHIMAHGSVLLKVPIRDAQRNAEKLIKLAAAVEFHHMDGDEIYTFFEGENMITRFMSPERVKELHLHILLRMTRFHQQEAIETNKEVLALMQIWISVPPEERETLRPVLVEALKALGKDNAEELLPLPVMQPQAPTQGGGAPQFNLPAQSQSKAPVDVVQESQTEIDKVSDSIGGGQRPGSLQPASSGIGGGQ